MYSIQMVAALEEHLPCNSLHLLVTTSYFSRFCPLEQVKTVTSESYQRQQVQMMGLAGIRCIKKAFLIPLILSPTSSAIAYPTTIKVDTKCDISRLSWIELCPPQP